MSSQLRISRKDCVKMLHNESGKERHGNYINDFSEKNYLGQSCHFGPKMMCLLNFGSVSGCFFLLILHSKRGQELHENFVSCFFEKKSHLGQFDLFRLFFTVWLSLVRIESGLCYYWILKQSGHNFFHDYYWILKQDMTRTLKQSEQDFSGKRICDGYFMDIMRCLCVEVNIQLRVVWFLWKSFFKNLLHNFVWM